MADQTSYVHAVTGKAKSTEECEPVMVLNEACLNHQEYSLELLGKVKEFSILANVKVALGSEGFSDIKLNYMGGTIKEDFGGSDREMEGENNVSVVPDTVREEENVQVEVEAGLDKNTTGINESSGAGGKKIGFDFCWIKELQKGGYQVDGGLLLTVIEELIKVGLNPKAKKDWVKEICASHKVNFLTLQETKMEYITLFDVKCCWGNFAFDHVYSPSVGNSGGILCVWEKSSFKKINSTVSDYFVMIRGTWVYSGVNLLNILVYAPQEFSKKKMLWDYLGQVIVKWNMEVIVMGDFNEVRLFHYWFEIDGFEEMISKAWCESPAKIKWAIEGDENKKYYHRILNKKRNQLAIRGVLKDGIWIENPNLVKCEFLLHFKNRFQKPCSVRPVLDMTFPRQLSAMQQIDMESDVSYQEIKRAVWDCGVDKFSGPDGFTFSFIRRFWSLLEKDVVAVVKYFFTSGTFTKGCNASFIALIPKISDAKMVKDFRPISLIGSLYKIIAKILANRFVGVLGDIVSEVQSAFVADRQILDGPFILNE
nr:RNA-directed DNA polymerase, eukaryota, reverse transcriptase zinc-binding domain protein [Tanacetum cinerariifolium]